MFNRFAGFGDGGGVPMRSCYRIGKATKPKVRNARREPVDEDDGDKVIPSIDKGHNMTDPFHAIIEKQARARQAVTGESFAKAFTECYVAPENAQIRDLARFEHLARGEDAISGTRLATPIQKAAPADAKQDFVQQAVEDRGPAHTKLHEMALEHSRAHGLSYQQSYTQLYTAPGNVSLRAGIAAEAGVRTLTLEEAMALAPAPAFPAYSSPGHEGEASNVGRSGAKPRGWAGG